MIRVNEFPLLCDVPFLLRVIVLSLLGNGRIGLTHAFQIGMQGTLIKEALTIMQGRRRNGNEYQKCEFRFLARVVVFSHIWDDLGDDPRLLGAWPELRSKVGDCLLSFDGDNCEHVFASVREYLLGATTARTSATHGVADTLDALVRLNLSSMQKSRWLRLSLLRLLASGLAQTEHANDPVRYRSLVAVVRRLSLELTRNATLRHIIRYSVPEFVLGTLASGSQELFVLSVPDLPCCQHDIDLLTAVNMLVGAPICFDKSIDDRRLEGMELPRDDVVSPNELARHLGTAVRVISELTALSPDAPTTRAYIGMVKRVHRLLSLPSPFSYARLDKVRPGQNGTLGFGSIIRNAFQQVALISSVATSGKAEQCRKQRKVGDTRQH